MIKNIFLIIAFYLTSSVGATNVLIKQGETKLTLQDIDGFAFKMPNDIRAGFFSKPDRVEKTLGTLLNMKHVYEYSKKNHIIDYEALNKNVDEKVQKLFAYDTSTDNLMEKEKTYKTIRGFLILEQNYKMFQEKMIHDISEKDVIEYSKEYYQLHRNKFQIPETRRLKYLSLNYNEENKEQQKKLMLKVKTLLENKKLDFNNVSQKKEFNEIKSSNIFKYFTYSYKQKKFSDFVFGQDSTGFVEGLLELDNKFLIVNILAISPTRIATFDEVKDELIEKFKKEKFQRDFKAFLAELTKDKVELNDENMKKLLTRYN